MARERFVALPVQRQNEWLAWIDRGRARHGRAERIDEAIRRLSPPAAEEEIVEPVGPPPERVWWVWLLLLLVLVVAGLLLWYFLSRGPGKTTVPAVVGLRSSDAAARLHAAHLKDSPTTGASTRPPGVVFAQRPGAGTQLDKNQTVTISISSGRAGTPVPTVTGLPEAQATRQLTAAGFKVQVQRRAGTRPKGIVFAQQPVAGVTAVKGTTVILSVSTGVQRVTVPSVVGQTQGAAVTQLTKLGLKPQLKNVPSAQPAGQVVAQKPPPGAKVDKGSTVALNVSSGSGSTTTAETTTTTTTTAARVPVPAVTGLAVTSGLRRLNAVGFHPILSYVSSTQPAGQIIRQRPAGGTAPTGSEVAVAVSTGPNPAPTVTVPDVAGQDQASAASAIRQAGLKPLVLFRKTTDQTQNGTVVDEQPAAGASIPAAPTWRSSSAGSPANGAWTLRAPPRQAWPGRLAAATWAAEVRASAEEEDAKGEEGGSIRSTRSSTSRAFSTGISTLGAKVVGRTRRSSVSSMNGLKVWAGFSVVTRASLLTSSASARRSPAPSASRCHERPTERYEPTTRISRSIPDTRIQRSSW